MRSKKLHQIIFLTVYVLLHFDLLSAILDLAGSRL